ncbi:MAG: FtsQ-type POTRA domain-containing protein, partial [Clostridia bacterium]|nr:FtsQ-type POTRA domain-containing protein [Clostridia bacterium]
WNDGEPVVRDPYASDGPLPADEGQAPDEPIRLFDRQDSGSFTRQESHRTHIFKTGQTTTTRVNMNQTEEAARQAREREARRRHEEHVERQNRKKIRRAAMRKLFGNIAFVILIFVGILVALYYTFLLSDIVVTGNEQYSSEYIIDLSGLQLGRHLLLCDLEQAAEDIAEDPYLQVEGVTYIFPSRVRIAISERKEVAGIIGLDYNVIIDRNGYVL